MFNILKICTASCPSPFCNVPFSMRCMYPTLVKPTLQIMNFLMWTTPGTVSGVRGWSPGHKVACSFCCFAWACPQAKSFTVWVKQDWLIGLELCKLSRIQGNIYSKAAGNCSESFLDRWNKGFGSNAFHSDLIESENPNTSVS